MAAYFPPDPTTPAASPQTAHADLIAAVEGRIKSADRRTVFLALACAVIIALFVAKEFGAFSRHTEPDGDSLVVAAREYVQSSPRSLRVVARDILAHKIKNNNEAVTSVAETRKAATEAFVKALDTARNKVVDKDSPTGDFKDTKEAAAIFTRAADAMESAFK